MEEQNLSTPAWMVTYADMVQLVLCFFIALFAFSQVDVEKFKQVASSLHMVFSGNSGVLDGQSAVLERPWELPVLEQTYRELEQYIEQEGLGERVELIRDERGILLSFADQVLFELGKADLLPPSREVLQNVAKIISPLPNQVMVEGHTDDLPIQTAQFPSNWELSTARATGVVRFFIEECGISPQRLSAAGYGEWRPRFPNDSPEHRAKNRRVDVLILRSEADQPQ